MKDLLLFTVPRSCVENAAKFLKTLWEYGMSQPRNACRRRRPDRLSGTQLLESRLLLTITQVSVDVEDTGTRGALPVFHWQDTRPSSESSVELWVDQVVSANWRNSRVLYVPEIDSATSTSTSTSTSTTGTGTGTAAGTNDSSTHRFRSTHVLPFGNYIAWLREHSNDGTSAWKRVDFQLDDDGDSQTDLPNVNSPASAKLSVLREGQGFTGHEPSESRIAWTSDELLHDIWVNKRQPDGRWAVYRRIRNVPGNSISFSDVQTAPQAAGFSYFGQLSNQSTTSLESGDYRFFVRAVNAATSDTGRWQGRSRWSSGVDFSYVRIENEAARPATLTVTDELSPEISWAPVAKAEYYLVSLWKGPDYSSHRPLIFRSHQTGIQSTAGVFRSGDREITIEPGDEIFVKVRAVGQDGTDEPFTSTNSVSSKIQIPQPSSVQASRPVISGPAGHTSGNQPLLSWNDVPNAETYEVWMSSVDDRRRIFLATDVLSSAYLLSPSILQELAESHSPLSSRLQQSGLEAGRYRFWVRAHSPVFEQPSPWSSAYDFEVMSNATMELDLNLEIPLANLPLVAPNLAIPFEDQGRSFLLLTNGKGESFGASVLAKYELNSNGSVQRPVIDGSNGQQELEFPDLPMGTNVSDMKRLSDGRIVVLSRGSSELRIVNPNTWQIDTIFSLVSSAANSSLLSDPANSYPDAIGLEVLSNDQVVVVFNRSDQIRIFNIADDGLSLQEADTSGDSSESGFLLTAGRGVQVSAVRIGEERYRFFVATPGQAAVVVYDYDAIAGSLAIVPNGSGATAFIRRSVSANPFHGGTVASIAKQGSSSTTNFYFSADRSGFLTWVHPETLRHGFIDLTDWMPSADRMPASHLYANPADNSFDSTRILSLDESRLVVMNSRQKSVLLQLTATTDGQVKVIAGAELPLGYGGAFLKHNGVEFIATTAVAPFSRNRQTSGVALTQLTASDGNDAAALIPGNPVVSVLANPIVAVERHGSGIILQQADASVQQVFANPTSGILEARPLGRSVPDGEGNDYVFTPDLFRTFTPMDSERDYLFVSAVRRSDQPDELAPVLLLLEFDDVAGLKVVKTWPVTGLNQLQSLTVSDSMLVILDRFGGQMRIIRDWKSERPVSDAVYDFGQQRPAEMGAIRPARSVILPNGTVVVVHDTFPDRGISEFNSNSLGSDHQNVPVFHANTTGTFSFDLHSFDEDRVITVSYGGDIVIFNVESGAWEFDTSVNDLSGSVSTYAVESSSYRENQLIINSPSAQTVTALTVTDKPEGPSFEVIGTHTDTDAIATIAEDNGYWIVGTGSVQRIFTGR